jgi:hypothetical protein
MVARLRSLQKRTMYDGARNLIIGWTLVCALGLIAGLLKIVDALPDPQVTAAMGITVGFWFTWWAYPVVGLAIIAVIVKPRGPQSKP